MRTVVHLSDLHFGAVDPRLLEPLRAAVTAVKPSVVVISGDLTQRARPEQFREARAFLDTLPRPQIVVPGNHDVPLYNVFRRFFSPLDEYKRHISQNLEPTMIDNEIAVMGVNTARSLTFKGGRINEAQVGRLEKMLCPLDRSVMRIVVTHHPFDAPVSADESALVGRAAMAMEMLARCATDILLAGHLHTSHAGSTAARYRINGYAALVVQAGTATSTRGRGEANAFNVLRIDGPKVEIERCAWDPAGRTFAPRLREVFTRQAEGWAKVR